MQGAPSCVTCARAAAQKPLSRAAKAAGMARGAGAGGGLSGVATHPSSPSPPRCPRYWYFPKQKMHAASGRPYDPAHTGRGPGRGDHRAGLTGCLPATRPGRGRALGAAGTRLDHDQGHKGGRWPSPAAMVTGLRTNPHPRLCSPRPSRPAKEPACGAPDLQGGQVLGQLLLELDGRQGWGFGHELAFGQGGAVGGALAHLFLPFFAVRGISVES